MQQSQINRTKEILKHLDDENVQYLDYSAYNEEEHDEKYQTAYIELFNFDRFFPSRPGVRRKTKEVRQVPARADR